MEILIKAEIPFLQEKIEAHYIEQEWKTFIRSETTIMTRIIISNKASY